jgi:hypothetical protein
VFVDDLVIHCAVLALPGDGANELLQYLVETCPAALEKKSTLGDTPLLAACRLGRRSFVRILIGANADQSVRNNKGENIIHAALAKNPSAHRLRALLDELDPDLRSHLFLQRKNLTENGHAPVQAWITQVVGDKSTNRNRNNYYWQPQITLPYQDREKDLVEVLQLLLEYSRGQGLDFLDGAGDTCLHASIMKENVAITKILVETNPSLLYRENAVGRTPAELAQECVTTKQISRPEKIRMPTGNPEDRLIKKDPEDFVRDAEAPEQVKATASELGLGDTYTAKDLVNIKGSMGLLGNASGRSVSDALARQVIWDICSTAMDKSPSNRRLVSLNEANDVARRLGEQETRSRYFSVESRKDDDDDDDDEAEDGDGKKDDKQTADFAATWLGMRLGSSWTTWLEHKGQEVIVKCKECDEYHD